MMRPPSLEMLTLVPVDPIFFGQTNRLAPSRAKDLGDVTHGACMYEPYIRCKRRVSAEEVCPLETAAVALGGLIEVRAGVVEAVSGGWADLDVVSWNAASIALAKEVADRGDALTICRDGVNWPLDTRSACSIW